MRKLILALPLLIATAACGGRYVESAVLDPEAKIRRSNDAEAIIAVMEEYERALGALDIDSIRRLVSEDYYENAGTTDTTRDDYGFDEVETMFSTLADHIEDVDVDIAVRSVVVEGDAADVLFEYTLRMRYVVATEAHWETERDVNRFQLQREATGWKIISGL